jgi:predicted DNA-binding protein
MEVQLTADPEAKLDHLAAETGRPRGEFVQDAITSYFEELSQTRQMLDDRYDEIRSGRVKPVPGGEVAASLQRKSSARRSQG